MHQTRRNSAATSSASGSSPVRQTRELVRSKSWTCVEWLSVAVRPAPKKVRTCSTSAGRGEAARQPGLRAEPAEPARQGRAGVVGRVDAERDQLDAAGHLIGNQLLDAREDCPLNRARRRAGREHHLQGRGPLCEQPGERGGHPVVPDQRDVRSRHRGTDAAVIGPRRPAEANDRERAGAHPDQESAPRIRPRHLVRPSAVRNRQRLSHWASSTSKTGISRATRT